MALTNHQALHLRAVLNEAVQIANTLESARVSKEAQEILDDLVVWPRELIYPYEIHDWIIDPTSRSLPRPHHG